VFIYHTLVAQIAMKIMDMTSLATGNFFLAVQAKSEIYCSNWNIFPSSFVNSL
jgi:hypothetical protein